MVKLSEILEKYLNEQDIKIPVAQQQTGDKTALGKNEQVNQLDIKATPTALIIYDHLNNKQKTYARVGNNYNVKSDLLNKDFNLKLTPAEFNKIAQKIVELITKYPEKAKEIAYPPYDIRVVLETQPDGTQKVKEISIENPEEKEKPKA